MPLEPPNSTSFRKLRDSLVLAEKWTLALELSLKCGFATTGVMAAWGIACLRAGCFDTGKTIIIWRMICVNECYSGVPALKAIFASHALSFVSVPFYHNLTLDCTCYIPTPDNTYVHSEHTPIAVLLFLLCPLPSRILPLLS